MSIGDKPAYPIPEISLGNSADPIPGLTFRERLIVAALAGLNANSLANVTNESSDQRAKWAISDADAVIARLDAEKYTADSVKAILK